MNIEDLRLLFDYNYWARDKLLDSSTHLDPKQFLAKVSSNYGSLQATLVHILSAEWVWRIRCEAYESPPSLLDIDAFPTVEILQSAWREEEGQMYKYLDSLSDDDLSRLILYKRTGGEARTNILGHILLHVINHGTEHRSEVASILTDFGHSPGDLDLIHYLREKEA